MFDSNVYKLVLLFACLGACCPIHGKLPQPALRTIPDLTNEELACLDDKTFEKVVVNVHANCRANQAEMLKIIESQK